MQKLQVSTTAGGITLSAMAIKFFELFGDYKLIQIAEAVKEIPIAELGIVLFGIGVSVYGIFRDDDKGKVVKP